MEEMNYELENEAINNEETSVVEVEANETCGKTMTTGAVVAISAATAAGVYGLIKGGKKAINFFKRKIAEKKDEKTEEVADEAVED